VVRRYCEQKSKSHKRTGPPWAHRSADVSNGMPTWSRSEPQAGPTAIKCAPAYRERTAFTDSVALKFQCLSGSIGLPPFRNPSFPSHRICDMGQAQTADRVPAPARMRREPSRFLSTAQHTKRSGALNGFGLSPVNGAPVCHLARPKTRSPSVAENSLPLRL